MHQSFISSVPTSPRLNESSTYFFRGSASQTTNSTRLTSSGRSPSSTSRVAIYENAKPKSQYEYECGYLRRPLTTLNQPGYHLSTSEVTLEEPKEQLESTSTYRTIAENRTKVYNESYYYRKGAKGSTDYRPYYAYYTPQNFSSKDINRADNNNLDQANKEGWSVEGIRTKYQSYSCLRHTKVYRTYYSPRVNGMDYHEHQFGMGRPWTHYATPLSVSLYHYKPKYISDYTRPPKEHLEIVGKSKEIEELDNVWRVAKGDEIGAWNRSSSEFDRRTVEILDGRKRRELEMDRKKKLYDPVETDKKRQTFVSKFGSTSVY